MTHDTRTSLRTSKDARQLAAVQERDLHGEGQVERDEEDGSRDAVPERRQKGRTAHGGDRSHHDERSTKTQLQEGTALFLVRSSTKQVAETESHTTDASDRAYEVIYQSATGRGRRTEPTSCRDGGRGDR